MSTLSTKNSLLWEKLKLASSRDHLGHALLLRHPVDLQNRENFYSQLKEFLKFIQCEAPLSSTQACEKCDSCRIYSHAPSVLEIAHPDFIFLKTLEDSLNYTVEQIRELSSQFSLRRALSPKRVVIISDAESLSWTGAGPANALLKLLEEPRPDSLLVLCSSRIESVLKTLQSRCHVFHFAPEKAGDTLSSETEWSELFDWIRSGAPGQSPANNPADQESFWKERSVAFEELRLAFLEAFRVFRESVGTLGLKESRRNLTFLNLWQEFLQNSRFHIQGHLHWLQIQDEVRSLA